MGILYNKYPYLVFYVLSDHAILRYSAVIRFLIFNQKLR
jgi:hypothetical protein